MIMILIRECCLIAPSATFLSPPPSLERQSGPKLRVTLMHLGVFLHFLTQNGNEFKSLFTN